jgi:hypothetical protein
MEKSYVLDGLLSRIFSKHDKTPAVARGQEEWSENHWKICRVKQKEYAMPWSAPVSPGSKRKNTLGD